MSRKTIVISTILLLIVLVFLMVYYFMKSDNSTITPSPEDRPAMGNNPHDSALQSDRQYCHLVIEDSINQFTSVSTNIDIGSGGFIKPPYLNTPGFSVAYCGFNHKVRSLAEINGESIGYDVTFAWLGIGWMRYYDDNYGPGAVSPFLYVESGFGNTANDSLIRMHEHYNRRAGYLPGYEKGDGNSQFLSCEFNASDSTLSFYFSPSKPIIDRKKSNHWPGTKIPNQVVWGTVIFGEVEDMLGTVDSPCVFSSMKVRNWGMTEPVSLTYTDAVPMSDNMTQWEISRVKDDELVIFDVIRHQNK